MLNKVKSSKRVPNTRLMVDCNGNVWLWTSEGYLEYNDQLLTTKDGYKYFIRNNRRYLLHRVVFETFGHKIPKDYVIDHINSNRADNRLSNLQCISQSENLKLIKIRKENQL